MSAETGNYWSQEGDKLYFTFRSQEPDKKSYKLNKHEVRLTDFQGKPLSNKEAIQKTFDTLNESQKEHAEKFWIKGRLVFHIHPKESEASIKVIVEPLAGVKIGVQPMRPRIHPAFEPEDVSHPIEAQERQREIKVKDEEPQTHYPKGRLLGERTGHLLTQREQKYVRKLQLEGKAKPGTYLDPKDHPLKCPVIIGNNGQAVAMYNKELGAGQYGSVYLAVDIDTGKPYIVKIPHSVDPGATQAKLRALAEAAKGELTALKDMGILLDTLRWDTGEISVQELAWGKDLSAVINDDNTLESQKVHVMNLVFKKLAEVHQNNYLHRDIKPENIMYDPEKDEVRIIDYGFAKEMEKGQVVDSKTVGTPIYLAPECYKGEYSPGSDEYSMGISAAVMLYRPSRPDFINTVASLVKCKDKDFPELQKLLVGNLPFDIRKEQERLLQELSDENSTLVKAIQKASCNPKTANKITAALKKAILTPNINLFCDQVEIMHSKNRRAGVPVPVPTVVKNCLPDVFNMYLVNPDVLRDTVNFYLRRMCSDTLGQRPSLQEVALVFDLIEKQYKLRQESKIRSTAVSEDFISELDAIPMRLKELAAVFKSAREKTGDKSNEKYLEFSSDADLANFMDLAKKLGFTESNKSTLAGSDFRRSSLKNSLEVSPKFLKALSL